MRNLMVRLYNDDRGALIAIEYLLIATILVLGVIVGLTNLRSAINAELTELGNAILALSQGYSINGTAGDNASTDGSQAIDTPGSLGPITQVPPFAPSVIDVSAGN